MYVVSGYFDQTLCLHVYVCMEMPLKSFQTMSTMIEKKNSIKTMHWHPHRDNSPMNVLDYVASFQGHCLSEMLDLHLSEKVDCIVESNH
jgi:hypothetical protein